MQDAKEEVRSKLNIEDVIAEYVNLKRAGRNFKGLSPFTSEKTPSFFVSPEKHIWHDFSSNKGGDVFSFVMEVEGLDFKGSLELLARKAGVDLSMYQSSSHRGLAKKKQRALSALDLAATYYQQSLLKNKHALEYVFKKRGMSKKAVQDFRIGYAPSTGNALVRFLSKRGFSFEEMRMAGLTSMRRGGEGDMFRGRIMVALADPQGQVIGFTARILQDIPNAPKYINTPQTILYDKSRHVFGLHLAKEAIRKAEYSVIVEGNLDVISSHQAGVMQVVATAGTAITEYHLKALSRLSSKVRLAFDADRAGVAATERAVPIAQKVGVDISIVTLPDGANDPDDLIKKDIEAWKSAINSAQPVVDWVLDAYKHRYDLTSAEGKRLFSDQALGVIRMLSDPVEQEHYLQLVAALTGASMAVLERKLSSVSAEREQVRVKKVKQSDDAPKDPSAYQDNILSLAAIDISVRELLPKLQPDDMNSVERKTLLEYMLAHPTDLIDDTKLPVSLHSIETYVKIVLLKADARYAAWSAQDRFIEAAKLVRLTKQENLKHKKDQLTNALRDAESVHDSETVDALRSELNVIIKELGSAKK